MVSLICTETTEIYTLSLHDALPIYGGAAQIDPRCRLALRDGEHEVHHHRRRGRNADLHAPVAAQRLVRAARHRSEEHTSELQSHSDLVCRLLLEKKKNIRDRI